MDEQVFEGLVQDMVGGESNAVRRTVVLPASVDSYLDAWRTSEHGEVSSLVRGLILDWTAGKVAEQWRLAKTYNTALTDADLKRFHLYPNRVLATGDPGTPNAEIEFVLPDGTWVKARYGEDGNWLSEQRLGNPPAWQKGMR